MALTRIGHSFTVADIAFRGTPIASPVFNEFDSFGALLSLPRLPDERNAAYKKRLLEVYFRRASSTYTGLLNGMTRELGQEWYQPIELNVKSGVLSSYSPSIEFTENKVLVYTDKPSELLEMEIDRGTPTSPAYLLNGFLEAIAESEVWEVTLLDETKRWSRTDCLVNQSSVQVVEVAPLRLTTRNLLGIGYIEEDSVEFSDTKTFRNQVYTEAQVSSSGKYYIDYTNGIVVSYSVPEDGATIRYKFNTFTEFKPWASPVIIRSPQDSNFQELLFKQIEGDDGEFTNGLPTPFGSEIINELMSVVPVYWGP